MADTSILDGFKAVADALSDLGGKLGGTALALAAAGIVAMALLQVLKELTPLRRCFQRWWIDRWLRARIAGFEAARAGNPNIPQASLRDAAACLVELATGSEERAFYDLPAEQLVAQMNAAAQISLDYPRRYNSLLAALSQGVAIEDFAAVLGPAPAPPAAAGAPAAAPAAVPLDARNRVGHRIQRNLDGVQIAMGDRWKFLMQLASLTLTVVIVEIAVMRTAAGGSAFFCALVVGIAAGYLAPVTRDIAAAIEKLRKP